MKQSDKGLYLVLKKKVAQIQSSIGNQKPDPSIESPNPAGKNWIDRYFSDVIQAQNPGLDNLILDWKLYNPELVEIGK